MNTGRAQYEQQWLHPACLALVWGTCLSVYLPYHPCPAHTGSEYPPIIPATPHTQVLSSIRQMSGGKLPKETLVQGHFWLNLYMTRNSGTLRVPKNSDRPPCKNVCPSYPVCEKCLPPPSPVCKKCLSLTDQLTELALENHVNFSMCLCVCVCVCCISGLFV